jgi:hypothetical protein
VTAELIRDAWLTGAWFERFRRLEGPSVPAGTMTMGVAEPEFAFRMKAGPRRALHWPATELSRHGHRLRPGDVVTTGTATPPCPIHAGGHVVAGFGALGSVEARSG